MEKNFVKNRVNLQIRAQTVRLIANDGENLGEKDFNEALNLAQEQGLDLVELNPNAKPPVCRILDFGKFKYQQNKDRRKNEVKNKTLKMKTIRVHLVTGDHDLKLKRDKALKFLARGGKVRIEMPLKGREKAHQDIAKEKLQKFIEPIRALLKGNTEIKRVPNGFSVDLRGNLEKLKEEKEEKN